MVNISVLYINYTCLILGSPIDNAVCEFPCRTLTKHPGGSERRLGCSLLQALLEDDDYEYPDECAYGLAHTYYLHGELRAARYFCESLLRMKPDSERAQRLHALVRMATSQKQDKALEFAAVGGTVLLGVAGLALAFAAGGKGKR
jgi:hypothetical protein